MGYSRKVIYYNTEFQFNRIDCYSPRSCSRDTNASPFDDANRRIDHDRGIFSSSSSFSPPAPPATAARGECMRVYRRTMQTKLASQCAAAAAGKLGKQLCEQCERAATSFTLPRHLVALVPLHFLHFVLCPSQSPAGIMRPA